MSSYRSISLLYSGPSRGLRPALRTRAAALTAIIWHNVDRRWHFCWYWRLKKDAVVRALRRRRDLRRWAFLFCLSCCRTNHVWLNELWRRPAGSHSRASFLPHWTSWSITNAKTSESSRQTSTCNGLRVKTLLLLAPPADANLVGSPVEALVAIKYQWRLMTYDLLH